MENGAGKENHTQGKSPMKNKLSFILCIILFTSCSITFVNVEKKVVIHGVGNIAEQGGANLKDNKLDQTTDGTIDGIPGI